MNMKTLKFRWGVLLLFECIFSLYSTKKLFFFHFKKVLLWLTFLYPIYFSCESISSVIIKLPVYIVCNIDNLSKQSACFFFFYNSQWLYIYMCLRRFFFSWICMYCLLYKMLHYWPSVDNYLCFYNPMLSKVFFLSICIYIYIYIRRKLERSIFNNQMTNDLNWNDTSTSIWLNNIKLLVCTSHYKYEVQLSRQCSWSNIQIQTTSYMNRK